MKKAGLTIRNFLIFFLTVALVSSCCLILFINMLQDTIGREFTREEITLAAKLTMIVMLRSQKQTSARLLQRLVLPQFKEKSNFRHKRGAFSPLAIVAYRRHYEHLT